MANTVLDELFAEVEYYRVPEWNPLAREAGSLWAYITKDAADEIPSYREALMAAVENGTATAWKKWLVRSTLLLQAECPDWIIMFVRKPEGGFAGRISALKPDRRPYNPINEVACANNDEASVLAALPQLIAAIKEKNVIPCPIHSEFARVEEHPLGGLRMIIKDRWATFFPQDCWFEVEFLVEKLNELNAA